MYFVYLFDETNSPNRFINETTDRLWLTYFYLHSFTVNRVNSHLEKWFHVKPTNLHFNSVIIYSILHLITVKEKAEQK